MTVDVKDSERYLADDEAYREGYDEGEFLLQQHLESRRHEAIADARKKNQVQLVTAFLIVGLALILLNVREDLANVLRVSNVFLLILSLSMIGLGAATFMLLYLRGAISLGLLEPRNSSSKNNIDESKIFEELLQLRIRVEALSQLAASSPSSAASSETNEKLISELALKLEDRFTNNASSASHIKEIRSSFSLARLRLENEVLSLGFRGNLNLVIGVLTTSLAVGLLAYMVLSTTVVFDNLPALLSHYVPRLSVVLFIEVFSFFFLRLYRATLLEIRTYQSDITNLTIKHIAVEAAWRSQRTSELTAFAKDLITASQPQVGALVEKAEASVDPKVLSDLLQKFGELVLSKDKK